jgi:hypothetical protein
MARILRRRAAALKGRLHNGGRDGGPQISPTTADQWQALPLSNSK